MPLASRGRTRPPKSSGGTLPMLRAGAGRPSRRGASGRGGGGGGGGGWVGRGCLALGSLTLWLVIVQAMRSWPQSKTMPEAAAASGHPEMPGAGGIPTSLAFRSRHGAEAEAVVASAAANGQHEMPGGGGASFRHGKGAPFESDEEASGDGEQSLTVDGEAEGEGDEEEHEYDRGEAVRMKQHDPGFPLGEDDIHVVFSTDCSKYQEWQAVVLFHSAIVSGHTGPITQLLSGCSEEEEEEFVKRHELVRHTAKHRLFFSPNFAAKDPKTGEAYPYMNKPNAMQLWFDQTEIHESIIALIDPDFIFLKPLTTWMSPVDTVVNGDGLSLEMLNLENGGWVRKGYPAGQRFELPHWTKWDRTKICPDDSICGTATLSVAKRYFDLIPPYLAHQDDWRQLLPEWVNQAPKVYDIYPDLLAEQTAYATAAATLNLKHYRLNNLAMRSEGVFFEIWDPVDQEMDSVCDIGIEPGDTEKWDVRSFDRMPKFIHYCQMYRVGHWLFSKRRFGKGGKDGDYDPLQCDTPLLELPPADIQNDAFKMHPGERYEKITPLAAKRNAFMLCMATRFVNSALRHFKGKMCVEDQPNLETTLRISG